MSPLVLATLLLALAFFLGRRLRTWRYVGLVVALLAVVAGFLVVNDGWYGNGWGEFGVELNVAVAALIVIAAAAGVGGSRVDRTE